MAKRIQVNIFRNKITFLKIGLQKKYWIEKILIDDEKLNNTFCKFISAVYMLKNPSKLTETRNKKSIERLLIKKQSQVYTGNLKKIEK